METILKKTAIEALQPSLILQLSPTERIELYKNFLQVEDLRIQDAHRAGAGGLEIANARAALIDTVIRSIHAISILENKGQELPIALVATGGYGRHTLNPRSDIDLLFLLPRVSAKLPLPLQEFIQNLLYVLWDVGFKIGHVCRSVAECIEEAKADQQNKTSLMDSRLVAGDLALFSQFQNRFAKECIRKGQVDFFELRRQDLRTRHNKYSRTVFLQEPNVKESCGGMRDYQNIQWVALVKRGTKDLKDLVDAKLLTPAGHLELEEAYDFLHRVRNELHYHAQKATDQLTLLLQGVVATSFAYPQKSILRSTEAFMRDYYRHTRNVYQHTGSLMDSFQIEQENLSETGLKSFLTFRKKAREIFDGFIAKEGRIYALNADIFIDDPSRMMRLFQHCQLRNLVMSPPMRKLFHASAELVDRPFRYSKINRETFQAILERKGTVASTLRQMHRVGFLGLYLPEFGALDCLVQHEFFHRYTADEHTLRCVDQLDQLIHETNPRREIYRQLFHKIEDPYALYLAVILHDSGRAENVREHIDGSAMLASRLCNRLQIAGARRTRIMFLVDNHLSFWRTATARNLDDPEVIAEFAGIVKTLSNLDALFLFTFADSNATSPEGWTSWKESLMLQLHTATRNFLEGGRENYSLKLDVDRLALRDEVLSIMREDYHEDVKRHFELMPNAAFSFRHAAQIVTQVRTIRYLLKREAETSDPHATCIKWIDQPEKGYTEVVIASHDKAFLLEKICCALASEQINILSADLFTREDSIVVNLFRVCTTNFETISSAATRARFLATFEAILSLDSYDPEKYLRRKVNFLKPRSDHGITVPVRAYISNDQHPTCTTVEIQGLDRIGLLHDLFLTLNKYSLNTAHARICTDNGMAMDTLYITTRDGQKIFDLQLIRQIEEQFTALVSRPETSY
jgi:[protein-PII] uridylyltransferase